MKPSIFLSSTVEDFRDLRSAMKHWLEELGFHVNSSESPDFKRDPKLKSFEACLGVVRNSEVYILMIGNRVGSRLEEGLSITHREYREARGVKGKAIICFVRSEIWEQYREYKRLSSQKGSEVKEPDDELKYLFDFISEVENDGASKKIGGNWITAFRDFKEIASAVQATLNIKENIGITALKKQMQEELSAFLRSYSLKNKDGLIAYYEIARKVVNDLKIEDEQDNFSRSIDLNGHMALFTTLSHIMLSPKDVMLFAMKEACSSPQLMEYNAQTKEMKISALQGYVRMTYLLMRDVLSEGFKDRMSEHFKVIHMANPRARRGYNDQTPLSDVIFFLHGCLKIARAYKFAENLYFHLTAGQAFSIPTEKEVPYFPYVKTKSEKSPWLLMDEVVTEDDLLKRRKELYPVE